MAGKLTIIVERSKGTVTDTSFSIILEGAKHLNGNYGAFYSDGDQLVVMKGAGLNIRGRADDAADATTFIVDCFDRLECL